MKRSTRINVPFDQVRDLAQRFDEHYEGQIATGFELMASSGFWQTKTNGITARFVYRRDKIREVAGRVTHTTIIRGIRP